jgi:hypothetical protein
VVRRSLGVALDRRGRALRASLGLLGHLIGNSGAQIGGRKIYGCNSPEAATFL